MTDNAIVQWDPNSGAQLPAYLTEAMGSLGSNIPDRQTVPSLSYEGKVWSIVKDGNKTAMQAKNSDGDMVPIPIMRAVILNFNADRGRAYYPGVYNPAESKQPDCWSADGKTPDASSKVKQHSSCQGCPMSTKGSKVQDGKEMVACSSHRMIAVAPAFEIESDPLRLKIAVTSDWDKEVVEHGWFAFRQYVDFLKSRGIEHTAFVVTKLKFDPNPAYPKILFSLDRLLSQEEVLQMQRALANPKVKDLLAERWSAAGTNGVDKNDADTAPSGLEAAYADGWISHPDAAGYSYKGQEVIDNAALAARYPAPPPAVKEEPAAPPPPPAASEPPAGTPLTAIELAEQDGWVRHPDAAGYHYKGQVVEATDKVAAMYQSQVATAEPEAPAAPPPAPAPAPEPEPVVEQHDPHAAALNDGWVQHPDSAPHGYKGSDVLEWAAIHNKYPAPAGNASAAPVTPAAPTASGDTAGQTATAAASPSDSGTVPPEVSDLLTKWN